ncbi:hypothetical protein LCGC14_0095980 [marine sediment metagenome]|uniref:DUF2330 domain-containing protein n=1 Tax=marine sediment metagenome TaxID=412755 RepID=A0A0F9VHZ1_9ZZZZ|nr:DUF2330 domain-containing protein [Phycisphaerae bacterium]HDZ43606.1 DUF2330 domain-containing protein [Phycisphaerae bacterium]
MKPRRDKIRCMTLRRPTALILLAFLGVASQALADGMMLPIIPAIRLKHGESTPMVTSPRQEAVLIVRGEMTRVILRTHFNAGPKELAWLVPVPAEPLEIATADEKVFERLDEWTAPTFYTEITRGLHLQCGCGAQDSAVLSDSKTVIVKAVGTAGVFDYVVLAATSADDLAAWLNEHHYAMPDSLAQIVGPYVRDGWQWLAMRVRPQEADKPTLAPHPITYTYRHDWIVYPLAISRPSAAQENEILLYVVADGPYQCENWANMTSRQMVQSATMTAGARVDDTIYGLERRKGTPSGTNYEDIFREETGRNDGRLFVAEYVGDYGRQIFQNVPGLDDGDALPPVLTRLRALVTPAAMDRDVELVPTDSVLPFRSIFHLTARRSHYAGLSGLGGIGVAFGLLFMAQHWFAGRRWRRAAAVACAAVACLLLTML